MTYFSRPGLLPRTLTSSDPTPDEIADRCAAIQAEWSAGEAIRRRTSQSRLATFIAKVSLTGGDEWPQRAA